MIGWLSGVVRDKDLEHVVLDVQGVGYQVFMPIPDLARLGPVGSQAAIHVHTHVREESLRLFGFSERATRGLFEKLITVSGIGPKTALALLSGIDGQTLARAVDARDLTPLTRVPGIGKKTAERLCLELRDKLDAAPGLVETVADSVSIDLVNALESLGYRRARAEEVAASLADKVEANASLEELVRDALKQLHKKP